MILPTFVKGVFGDLLPENTQFTNEQNKQIEDSREIEEFVVLHCKYRGPFRNIKDVISFSYGTALFRFFYENEEVTKIEVVETSKALKTILSIAS